MFQKSAPMLLFPISSFCPLCFITRVHYINFKLAYRHQPPTDHGYWTLHRNLVQNLHHWASFYFRCGAHPVTLAGKDNHIKTFLGLSKSFTLLIYLKLFLPPTRANILFADLNTIICIVIELKWELLVSYLWYFSLLLVHHVVSPSAIWWFRHFEAWCASVFMFTFSPVDSVFFGRLCYYICLFTCVCVLFFLLYLFLVLLTVFSVQNPLRVLAMLFYFWCLVMTCLSHPFIYSLRPRVVCVMVTKP